MAQPSDDIPQSANILHANCVALGGKGLLIVGPSGSGKSSLSLELMALGAGLVADDRTRIEICDGRLRASPVKPIDGLIEARGVGILKADFVSEVFVDLVVNLELTEAERLPKFHKIEILGQELPCYYRVESHSFPAALMQLLKAGRHS